jgi:hypothetical protein
MKVSDVRNMVLRSLASPFDSCMNRKSDDEGFARAIPGGRQEVLDLLYVSAQLTWWHTLTSTMVVESSQHDLVG